MGTDLSMEQANKGPVVLVHGAWHGGWCWHEVADKLEHQGRKVYAPTLSGMAHRRAGLHRDISADTHVVDIASLVEALDLKDVTLVLHSYAGLLGPALLHRLDGRLKEIAWLEAVIPSPGMPMLELTTPEAAARYTRLAASEGEGWWMPPPSATQFQLPTSEMQQYVDQHLTPQPFRTFSEPVTLPQADVRAFPGRYMLASDRNPQPYLRYAAIATDAGWPVLEAPGGHLMMLTNSDAVVNFLK